MRFSSDVESVVECVKDLRLQAGTVCLLGDSRKA